MATRTAQKLVEIKDIIRPDEDVALGLLGSAFILFLTPNFLLKLLVRARGRQIEEEVNNLEKLFMVVGGVPDITVEKILPLLIDNSRYLERL